MEIALEKLKKTPIENLQKYLDTEKISRLYHVKIHLDDLYYNVGESPISDRRYDMLVDTLKKRDPKYSPKIGAKLRKDDNRVILPYWLGSADKITPNEPDAFYRWKKDNPASKYVVSDKLDGVSCLIVHTSNTTKLYTRGDGEVGADITYLLPYFKTIPKLQHDIAVRGELIIKKRIFQQKYRSEYRNARNMVAGLIGAKTARKGLKDVDFVSYEIVGDHMPKMSSQLKQLVKLGFLVVNYKIIKKLTIPILEKIYREAKETSSYEIDGMIVQSNVPYDRNTSGNPEYMFAFKMLFEDAINETVVQRVEWNVSKWGQLKPVVIVEPIDLADVTINRATAHNAKYVKDNGLGPGAIVKIVRSKDVIPYIVDVVKSVKPQMPNIDYDWDKNHVNIVVKSFENTICIKLIAEFFAKLGIKHVSEQTIRKMYNHGLTNLFKILGASKRRLMAIPEFGQKSVDRIYTNIHQGLKNVKKTTVLGASGVLGFGIGQKRMEALFLDYPKLLSDYKTMTRNKLINTIISVEGFSYITAEKIADSLKFADILIKKLSKYTTWKESKRVSDNLKGKTFVMTGFRNKTIEEAIAERGGKVTGSVSSKTTALIVKSKQGKLTGKLKKANDLGKPIYTIEEFKNKFLK